MSLPPDLLLPTDRLHVTALSDPVVDLVGHDLRSTYVERFWLPVLGPTTVLLLRRLAADLEEQPEGFDLPILDTALALGLGTRSGRNAPFLRAVARATKFKITASVGPGTLAVRRRVAPLNRTQCERLPPLVRDEHAAWVAEAARVPDPEQVRRRARRLALSLLELGEDAEAVEQQLHRWKLHPALAHEALRWALQRQVDAPDRSAAADGVGEPRAADAPRAARPSPQLVPAFPPPRAPGRVPPPTGDAA